MWWQWGQVWHESDPWLRYRRTDPAPPALISVASWFSGMYTFIKKVGFYFSAGGHFEIEFVCYSWSYVNNCYAGVMFVSLKKRMCCEVNGEWRVKVPLPRDRALAGTSREVTSKFLKELEGEGVWLFNYLKIIAFLTLSMIINFNNHYPSSGILPPQRPRTCSHSWPPWGIRPRPSLRPSCSL